MPSAAAPSTAPPGLKIDASLDNSIYDHFELAIGKLSTALKPRRAELVAILRELVEGVGNGSIPPPSPIARLEHLSEIKTPPLSPERLSLSPRSKEARVKVVRAMRAQAEHRVDIARRARASAEANLKAMHEHQLEKLKTHHEETIKQVREDMQAQFEEEKREFVRHLSGKSASEVIEKLRRELLFARQAKVVEIKDTEIKRAQELVAEKDAAISALEAKLADANSKYISAVLDKREVAQELASMRRAKAEAEARVSHLEEQVQYLESKSSKLDAQVAEANSSLADFKEDLSATLNKMSTVLLSTRLPNGFTSALVALDPEGLRREAAIASGRSRLRLSAGAGRSASCDNVLLGSAKSSDLAFEEGDPDRAAEAAAQDRVEPRMAQIVQEEAAQAGVEGDVPVGDHLEPNAGEGAPPAAPSEGDDVDESLTAAQAEPEAGTANAPLPGQPLVRAPSAPEVVSVSVTSQMAAASAKETDGDGGSVLVQDPSHVVWPVPVLPPPMRMSTLVEGSYEDGVSPPGQERDATAKHPPLVSLPSPAPRFVQVLILVPFSLLLPSMHLAPPPPLFPPLALLGADARSVGHARPTTASQCDHLAVTSPGSAV